MEPSLRSRYSLSLLGLVLEGTPSPGTGSASRASATWHSRPEPRGCSWGPASPAVPTNPRGVSRRHWGPQSQREDSGPGARWADGQVWPLLMASSHPDPTQGPHFTAEDPEMLHDMPVAQRKGLPVCMESQLPRHGSTHRCMLAQVYTVRCACRYTCMDTASSRRHTLTLTRHSCDRHSHAMHPH